MACFLVPAAEAIVVTVAAQAIKRSEQKKGIGHVKVEGAADISDAEISLPVSRKLMLLSYLLWGGALLLAFEHVWHGEVVPWFPFLTAAADPSDAAQMLHEMSTVGVTMAIIVTGVWAAVTVVVTAKVKRIREAAKAGA